MKTKMFLEVALDPSLNQELNLTDDQFYELFSVTKREISPPYQARLQSLQRNKIASYLKNARIAGGNLTVIWSSVPENAKEKKDAIIMGLKNARSQIEIDDSGINKLLRKYEGCPYNFDQYSKYIKEEKFLAAAEFLHLVAQCIGMNGGYLGTRLLEVRQIIAEEV